MKFSFFLLCFFSLTAAAQVADSFVYRAYLQKNSEILAVEKQAPIQLFDAGFYKNSLFLFGENHGSAVPVVHTIQAGN
jgi:hypothetical protein